MHILTIMIQVWFQRFWMPGGEFVYMEYNKFLDDDFLVRHNKKKSWVKSLWIFLGSIVLFNPSPVMATLFLIFGTFFSFLLLDETD